MQRYCASSSFSSCTLKFPELASVYFLVKYNLPEDLPNAGEHAARGLRFYISFFCVCSVIIDREVKTQREQRPH